MARVTVEDCIQKIPNRFDLVLKAAQRSRDIAGGALLNVLRDNDKNPVIALREIADTDLDLNDLENSIISSLQRFHDRDEPEVMDDDEAFSASMEAAGEFDNALSADMLDGFASEFEGIEDDLDVDSELDSLNDELSASDLDTELEGMSFSDSNEIKED